MASFLLLAAYLLAAGLVYLAYLLLRQYTYWSRHKMLQIEFVPILGNTAPIVTRSESFGSLGHKLYKRHPGARYYGMFDFNRPTLVIKDPELIREVCIKSFDSFVDHDAFVSEEMDPIIGRTLFSLKGQRWREMRNTLTPSFTAARMKVLFDLIAECSKDFVQYFVEHPEVAKEFEAKDAFTRYTNDVIGTAAFGVKVDSMKDRDNEFYRHGKAFTSFTGIEFVKFLLMQTFPTLMRYAGATFLPRSTDRFFKKLIRDTVRTRKEKGIVRQDMIHLMMLAMDKHDGTKVTVDDIIAQAFFFFLAGFDTTASLTCFIALELADNLDIQERLRQEVDKQVEEDHGKITYESLTKMKYLDMVVSETLRKYPAAPITNRVCVKEYEFPPPMEGYDKYHAEVDVGIFIPIYGVHRDAKYYPDPDIFDPERFSDENKSSIIPHAYMPFGIGPRQCIGNRFALMEAKIVIIDILRKFVIKFTEKSKFPVTYDTSTFSLTAKEGFWLQFEERKKVD